jgi:hypothetical protein
LQIKGPNKLWASVIPSKRKENKNGGKYKGRRKIYSVKKREREAVQRRYLSLQKAASTPL